jgi:hypothetical protein
VSPLYKEGTDNRRYIVNCLYTSHVVLRVQSCPRLDQHLHNGRVSVRRGIHERRFVLSSRVFKIVSFVYTRCICHNKYRCRTVRSCGFSSTFACSNIFTTSVLPSFAACITAVWPNLKTHTHTQDVSLDFALVCCKVTRQSTGHLINFVQRRPCVDECLYGVHFAPVSCFHERRLPRLLQGQRNPNQASSPHRKNVILLLTWSAMFTSAPACSNRSTISWGPQ